MADGGVSITGAGVVPYCFDHNQNIQILFHRTKTGKKVGFWIDFGGAFDAVHDADAMSCAAREFSEETFGAYYWLAFAPHAAHAVVPDDAVLVAESTRWMRSVLTGCMPVVQLVCHGYYAYFVHVPHVDDTQLIEMVNSRHTLNKIESYRWLSLADLQHPDTRLFDRLPRDEFLQLSSSLNVKGSVRFWC